MKKPIDIFAEAWLYWPGTKLAMKNEFGMFCTRHKDWKKVIPLLLPAMKAEEIRRNNKHSKNAFVPPWKNLKTWLGRQRCWEETEGRVTKCGKARHTVEKREKFREKIRDEYEYLRSKRPAALMDYRKDLANADPKSRTGWMFRRIGWFVDEIIAEKQKAGRGKD